jgi:small subunit ribosomal protein S1
VGISEEHKVTEQEQSGMEQTDTGAPERQESSPETPAAGAAEAFRLGQRVWGPILRMTEDHVVISLSEHGLDEGTLDLVHLRDEFGNLSVAEGDEVQAFIVKLEPAIKLAPSLYPPAAEVMRHLREALDGETPVRGRVTGVNRGGLDVHIEGRRAFCPFSQIELGRCEDPTIYLNHILDFRVLELDEERKRIVLTRRPILEAERKEKLTELRAQITAGAEFEGVVRRLQPFGAFVDIGDGIEGLVHVSEISHDRVEHPSEVLREGEKIRVRVLDVSRGKEGRDRIKLSLKATIPDPWSQVTELLHERDIVTGSVVRVTDFGAFVKLHPGIEGLLHVSQYKPRGAAGAPPATEAAGAETPAPADATPKAGEEITVRITRIDAGRRRISLALRDEDRVDQPKLDHDAIVGETVEGVVRTIKRYGVFLDLPSLGPWVSGLLPTAETEFGPETNIARKFNQGDKVKVEIIDVDDRGRIRLSQRRLTEREALGAAGEAGATAGSTAAPGGFNAIAEAFKRAEARQQRKAEKSGGSA